MNFFDDNIQAELDKFGKAIVEEIGQSIKTAGNQISNTNSAGGKPQHKTQEYSFTDNFLDEAKSWGLTKADALDVYYYGFKTGDDKIIREYNEYEIGIKYKYDPNSGIPIIDSIWKK